MFKLKFLLILSLTINCVFSSEFDDMFGESKNIEVQKNKEASQYDIFGEEKNQEKKKINQDDFMDIMSKAEDYSKQRVIFDNLITNARKKSKRHSFESAYEILDRAYAMNFDNKKVSMNRNWIEDDENKYRKKQRDAKKAKREQERKRRKAEEIRAQQENESQLRKQALFKSLDNTLKKQQQINRQAKANLDALIKRTNQNNFSKKKTYASTTNYNEQTVSNSKYNNTSSYDRKKKEREAKEREATLKRKKLERERANQEKELKRKEEKENKQKIEQQYFSKLKSGINLVAKQCYGEHHIGGIIPKYSPKPVSCIDVSFVATCRNNSTKRVSGLMENMQSNSGGCFGDTKKVTPKLNCDAKDYIVKVTNVTECR